MWHSKNSQLFGVAVSAFSAFKECKKQEKTFVLENCLTYSKYPGTIFSPFASPSTLPVVRYEKTLLLLAQSLSAWDHFKQSQQQRSCYSCAQWQFSNHWISGKSQHPNNTRVHTNQSEKGRWEIPEKKQQPIDKQINLLPLIYSLCKFQMFRNVRFVCHTRQLPMNWFDVVKLQINQCSRASVSDFRFSPITREGEREMLKFLIYGWRTILGTKWNVSEREDTSEAKLR